MKMVTRFELPAKKGAGKTWTLDLGDFRKWADEWGFDAKTTDSELETMAIRRRLAQAEPKVITGDLNKVAKRLNVATSTLLDYRKLEGCPVEKGEGNQWRIDLNAWELWRIKNKIGPYAEHGKHKGGVPIWT
jgi:hypothetical protein